LQQAPLPALTLTHSLRSDDEQEVDAEKLRKYERERLRYFYAVVECDSAATGAALFGACDGIEFERSSTRLDLRFVPEGQSFAERSVRDAATSLPAGYAPVDYTAQALQQTRVALTWDADDPDRKRHLRRKVSAEQLKDEDLAAYLGSGSDEDDEEEGDEAARQAEAARVRHLFLGAGEGQVAPGGWQGAPKRSQQRDQAGDMVVTFGVGLEERLQARKAQAGGDAAAETLWAQHLRERKAKRAAAKSGAAEQAFALEQDEGFQDAFFASASAATDWHQDGEPDAARPRRAKKPRRDAAQAAMDEEGAREVRRRGAELELLVMDDARLRQGQLPAQPRAAQPGDADAPARLSRKQARVAAKAAKLARKGGADGSQLDAEDPRFAALFTRPEFALDPTDPRNKGSRTAALVSDRRQRAAATHLQLQPAAADPGDDWASVVTKFKRKAGQR